MRITTVDNSVIPSPCDPVHPGAGSAWPLCAGLLLLVACILIVSQPAMIYRGDAISVRYATINLIQQGTIDVDPNVAKNFGERGQYFYENVSSGAWYPKYGILNTLLYVPPLLIENVTAGSLQDVVAMDEATRHNRTFYLNYYNIALSLLFTGYLFFVCRLFCESSKVIVFFVISCLFGTFAWNYLRAQTFEIFQLCFFCGLYYHLLRYSRLIQSPENRISYVHFWLVLLFTSLLVLEKSVFAALVPVVLVYLIVAEINTSQDKEQPQIARFLLVCKKRAPQLVFFLIGLTGIVLLSNWYRFGAPFTTGYAQWEKEQHFLSGHLIDGLYGYLFDSQKSIFLYFPLLFFALFRVRSFFRKYQFEYSFLIIIFYLFYLINSLFINWRGDWCYGPRYLLFILPLLSLPVLELFVYAKNSKQRIFETGLKIALFITLLWSGFNQVCVNSLAFESPFLMILQFQELGDERMDQYLKSPFWAINQDLILHHMGRKEFPPLAILRQNASEKIMQKKIHYVEIATIFNYYVMR